MQVAGHVCTATWLFETTTNILVKQLLAIFSWDVGGKGGKVLKQQNDCQSRLSPQRRNKWKTNKLPSQLHEVIFLPRKSSREGGGLQTSHSSIPPSPKTTTTNDNRKHTVTANTSTWASRRDLHILYSQHKRKKKQYGKSSGWWWHVKERAFCYFNWRIQGAGVAPLKTA